MHSYSFHGFPIDSDLALPELSAPAGIDAWSGAAGPRSASRVPALVRIACTDDGLLAELPVPGYCIRVDADDRHRFLIPEGAVLAVGTQGEASYATRSTCPADLLRHVLIGQLLPNALALAPRGVAVVLHASVVRCANQAVAFLGEGGIGKSSLAAACHAAGLTVLCDDCAPVVADPEGARLLVQPGLGRMKLWPDTVAALHLEAHVIGAIHERSTKLLLDVRGDAGAPQQPLPLACIYQLMPGPALAVRTIPPADAIARLYQQCFGHRRASSAGRAQHFTQVGAVAVTQPVCELSVPRGLEGLGAVVALVRSRHGG